MNTGSAHHQRQRQEHAEEEMTSYAPRELADDWEFKILRSISGEFRRPQRLAEILDQESRAGWMLVEKFDDRRIRLKRRSTASKDDRNLDFDPYRSYVGTSESTLMFIIAGVTLAAGLAIFSLVLLLQ
jgi:hypothetical protein